MIFLSATYDRKHPFFQGIIKLLGYFWETNSSWWLRLHIFSSFLHFETVVFFSTRLESFSLQQELLFLSRRKAEFTQDARRDAHANWNLFPLMLLSSSVNTPIDNSGPHLLPLRCASLCASLCASCVNGAKGHVKWWIWRPTTQRFLLSDRLWVSQSPQQNGHSHRRTKVLGCFWETNYFWWLKFLILLIWCFEDDNLVLFSAYFQLDILWYIFILSWKGQLPYT